MHADGLQRIASTSTRLLRLGIRNTDLAMALLLQAPLATMFEGEALDDLDLAADPDQALSALADMANAAPGALAILANDHGARHRVLAVLGT